MEKIRFIGSALTISDEAANIEKFKTYFADGSKYNFINRDTYNDFIMNYHENYLTIYISSGKPFPHPPEVTNIETGEPEQNPRTTTQIEGKQSFALIDFTNSRFWISNSKKKSTLIDFFAKTFKKNVREKEIYNKEQFIAAINRINEIKFSAAPNLFTDANLVTAALKQDMDGYGAEIATLYLKFGNTRILPPLLDKIVSLINNSEEVEDIVISGRDEAGRGMIFNGELFAKSITVDASTDANEMFKPGEVFTNLINSINNEG